MCQIDIYIIYQINIYNISNDTKIYINWYINIPTVLYQLYLSKSKQTNKYISITK